jgi:hypothetical protein
MRSIVRSIIQLDIKKKKKKKKEVEDKLALETEILVGIKILLGITSIAL